MQVKRISPRLSVDVLDNGHRKLKRDLVYEINGKKLIVPKNFETDFSSHPPFSRFIVRFDKVDYAGVVHDYLYKTGIFNGEFISRWFADQVWYAIARSGTHNASWLQASLSWAGLFVGGWWTWGNYRRKDKKMFNE